MAEDEQGIAGVALAIRREGIWGLSLLIVRPDQQSSGLGGALLRRADEYAAGARGRIILVLARLARAARLRPARPASFTRRWTATACRAACAGRTASARAGADDLPLTEEVDRYVRGAAHGDDIGAQLEMGQTLLIAPGRGYAVTGDGDLRLLAAFDDDSASDLLRAALAHAGDRKANVSWITSSQQWALRVCLEAGLELTVARRRVPGRRRRHVHARTCRAARSL